MATQMWRRRNTWIVALAALAVGALAALWQDRSVWTSGSSPQMTSVLEAEKERQRREAMEAAAEKQKRLDERQLAEARRIAEEDRRRREAAILQALQKQKDAEAAAKRQQQDAVNLAAAERMLAQQHAVNTDIARASEFERQQKQAALELRKEEERRLADTIRALEQERIRTAGAVQASLKQRQEAERRLADAVRVLEQERIRTASAVQASLKQRSDQDQKLVDAAPGAAPPKTEAAKPAEPPAPARVAAAGSRVPPAAKPAARAGKRSATRRTKAARAVPCRPGRCRAPRAARRGPARTTDPIARAVVDLCPLRWLDAVLTDMHRRLSTQT